MEAWEPLSADDIIQMASACPHRDFEDPSISVWDVAKAEARGVRRACQAVDSKAYLQRPSKSLVFMVYLRALAAVLVERFQLSPWFIWGDTLAVNQKIPSSDPFKCMQETEHNPKHAVYRLNDLWFMMSVSEFVNFLLSHTKHTIKSSCVQAARFLDCDTILDHGSYSYVTEQYKAIPILQVTRAVRHAMVQISHTLQVKKSDMHVDQEEEFKALFSEFLPEDGLLCPK